MAIAAIAAVGCLAGVLGLRTSENGAKSALTIANVEALSGGESGFSDCENGCSTKNHGDYCCTLFGMKLFFPEKN